MSYIINLHLKIIAIVILFMSVTGCSFFKKDIKLVSMSPKEIQAYIDKKKEIDSWYITGKIGIVSKKQSGSLSFKWRHASTTNASFEFSDPLGNFVLSIISDSDFYVAKDAAGNEAVSTSVDDMVEAVFGVSLPIDSLHYWVIGIPYDKEGYIITSTDEFSNIRSFKQQEFEVDYTYSHASAIFPKKIRIFNKKQNITLKIFLRKRT